MKFHYSTRLNPSERTNNRVSLVSHNVALVVVDGKRSFFNINISELPFTTAINRAHVAVCEQTEIEYFNIGTRPEEPFKLEPSDILHINYIMFLTAMRRAQARHTWFKSVPQYFTSYVREDILASPYIHRLKLVTLQALYEGWSPRRHMGRIRNLYKVNGFPEETAMLYTLFWISGEAQRTIESLLTVKEPFVLDFDALIEESNIIVAESNLASLAKYIAMKKLTFIANSNRFSVDDFAADILNRARQAYLMCRPFLARTHSLNYARATVSTYPLRIIQHFQSSTRARLLNNHEGGYDNRFVSLDENAHDETISSEDQIIELIDMKKEMLGAMFSLR